VGAVWFRGAHSDYLIASRLGELLVREPGAPCRRVAEPVGWTLLRGWPIPAPPSP